MKYWIPVELTWLSYDELIAYVTERFPLSEHDMREIVDRVSVMPYSDTFISLIMVFAVDMYGEGFNRTQVLKFLRGWDKI